MQFFGGMIIGLAGAWVLNLFYWQRKRDTLKTHLTQSKVQGDLISPGKEDLQAQLMIAEAEISQLETDLATCQQQANSVDVVEIEKDNLEKIRGIGSVFSKKLNEAGVYTFAQLVRLGPEQIKDIIKAPNWQKVTPEDWIAEAQSLDHAQKVIPQD